MGRSVAFVIESDPRTHVRISENLDGTLSIELGVLGDGARISDLSALYLDLNGVDVDDALVVYGDAGISDRAVLMAGVDTLGRSATLRGGVVNDLGDFDVGIEFETSGPARDDLRSTGITLAHDRAALTLDTVDLADFGLRYTSRAATDGGRVGSALPGAEIGPEALALVDQPVANVSLLARDGDGGVLAVIDVHGTAGGGEARPEHGGRRRPGRAEGGVERGRRRGGGKPRPVDAG